MGKAALQAEIEISEAPFSAASGPNTIVSTLRIISHALRHNNDNNEKITPPL